MSKWRVLWLYIEYAFALLMGASCCTSFFRFWVVMFRSFWPGSLFNRCMAWAEGTASRGFGEGCSRVGYAVAGREVNRDQPRTRGHGAPICRPVSHCECNTSTIQTTCANHAKSHRKCQTSVYCSRAPTISRISQERLPNCSSWAMTVFWASI
jgi:hypothetical protein